MHERTIGLQSGCILHENEGLRISTMSRHTLNNGKTPHPKITPDSFDYWMKELAPPDALVGAWYKNQVSWAEFETYYKTFLTLPLQEQAIAKLITMAKQTLVTVMCIEETPEKCHRRLLLEECMIINPKLVVRIH